MLLSIMFISLALLYLIYWSYITLTKVCECDTLRNTIQIFNKNQKHQKDKLDQVKFKIQLSILWQYFQHFQKHGGDSKKVLSKMEQKEKVKPQFKDSNLEIKSNNQEDQKTLSQEVEQLKKEKKKLLQQIQELEKRDKEFKECEDRKIKKSIENLNSIAEALKQKQKRKENKKIILHEFAQMLKENETIKKEQIMNFLPESEKSFLQEYLSRNCKGKRRNKVIEYCEDECVEGFFNILQDHIFSSEILMTFKLENDEYFGLLLKKREGDSNNADNSIFLGCHSKQSWTFNRLVFDDEKRILIVGEGDFFIHFQAQGQIIVGDMRKDDRYLEEKQSVVQCEMVLMEN